MGSLHCVRRELLPVRPSRPLRRSSMPGLTTSGDAPPAATAEAGQPDGASPVGADPPRGSDPAHRLSPRSPPDAGPEEPVRTASGGLHSLGRALLRASPCRFNLVVRGRPIRLSGVSGTESRSALEGGRATVQVMTDHVSLEH
jgi:hypothetical protein